MWYIIDFGIIVCFVNFGFKEWGKNKKDMRERINNYVILWYFLKIKILWEVVLMLEKIYLLMFRFCNLKFNDGVMVFCVYFEFKGKFFVYVRSYEFFI